MTGLMYWALELLKLSVLIGVKQLPFKCPKNYFIVAEITKLVVVGLVMFGIEVVKPDVPPTPEVQPTHLTTLAVTR